MHFSQFFISDFASIGRGEVGSGVVEERARASQNERRRRLCARAVARCPPVGTPTLRADADGTEEDYGDKQVYLTTVSHAGAASPLFFYNAQAAQGFPIFSFPNICSKTTKISHKFQLFDQVWRATIVSHFGFEY